MNLFVRLALGFVGAAVPVLAMAAPPNVTGITAVNEGGRVRVTWNQVQGDIRSYRIFYSHASILGNGGLYDDFESVDGTVNTHLLQTVPPVDELFVSILAVDGTGAESPYFLEEARVTLNGNGPTSAASSAAQSQPVQGGDMLRLMSAQAVSATGVLLTFSHPVSIPQAQAAQAIMIDAGSGRMLQMRRYVLEGNTVLVHTVAQERGTAYRVTVASYVTGKAGTQALALAADQTPVLFTGHASGVAPMPGQQPSGQTVSDVTNLRLRAQPENGAYTVEATWQTPAGTIAGYSVSQTTDGGRTYSAARMVDKSATAVKVPGVPAGQFGILVKVVAPDGTQSRGIAQIINLPALQGGSQFPGTVTPMPNQGSTPLPSSGPALWLAVSGAGSLVGAWQLRRTRRAAAVAA